MTKQSTSGETMGQAFEVTKGKETWSGQEVSVDGGPLVDNATGRPIILRFFEFKANPETFKLNPSKQELFNNHAQQIRLFLWKDGLDIVTAIEPKVIKSHDSYKIAVTCQPKLGVTLIEKPQTLQQITTNNG